METDYQKLLNACKDYRAMVDKLERENAALREDKARLDWLDSIGRNVKNVNMDGVWREWSHRDYLNTKVSLRESIDAARKEVQP